MPFLANGVICMRILVTILPSFVENVLSCKVIPHKANKSLKEEGDKEQPECDVTPEVKLEDIVNTNIIDIAMHGMIENEST